MTLTRSLLFTTVATVGTALFSSGAFSQAVTYDVNGSSYEGYYADAGKGKPLVLLLHDWDGLTDYEIKRADMLKEQGYSVFAADLFGKGVRPTKDEDKMQHTGDLYKDRNKLRSLTFAALQEAYKQGANIDNTVVMGYCFGGAATLEFARSGKPMKGFVSFHGGLTTPPGQSYEETKGSVLVFHGSADTMISLQDLATLGDELEKNNVPNELISYGGAPHAFTVFGSDRYREEADKQSWKRFLEYLNETLKL